MQTYSVFPNQAQDGGGDGVVSDIFENHPDQKSPSVNGSTSCLFKLGRFKSVVGVSES